MNPVKIDSATGLPILEASIDTRPATCRGDTCRQGRDKCRTPARCGTQKPCVVALSDGERAFHASMRRYPGFDARALPSQPVHDARKTIVRKLRDSAMGAFDAMAASDDALHTKTLDEIDDKWNKRLLWFAFFLAVGIFAFGFFVANIPVLS